MFRACLATLYVQSIDQILKACFTIGLKPYKFWRSFKSSNRTIDSAGQLNGEGDHIPNWFHLGLQEPQIHHLRCPFPQSFLIRQKLSILTSHAHWSPPGPCRLSNLVVILSCYNILHLLLYQSQMHIVLVRLCSGVLGQSHIPQPHSGTLRRSMQTQ